MQELAERLIRCGVPERAAIVIAETFAASGRLEALRRYVEAEEKACGVETV